MALGDYSPTAWVNGTAPAISASNLLNIENKVDELDNYAGNNRGILSLTVTSANVTLSAAQALNDVIVCSGTLTGNRSVIIPAGIKKTYRVIIKNTANYYIRFITASTGTYFDAYGLISTDETAIQSSYSFDIVTDGTDVYGDSWAIRGSNANGSYKRESDGMLLCRYINSSTSTTSTAAGNIFRDSGSTYTFPYAYSIAPQVAPAGIISTGFGSLSISSISTTQTVIYGFTNINTGVVAHGYIARGVWK